MAQYIIGHEDQVMVILYVLTSVQSNYRLLGVNTPTAFLWRRDKDEVSSRE